MSMLLKFFLFGVFLGWVFLFGLFPFFLSNVEPFHRHNWALPSVKGCSTIEVWIHLSSSVEFSIPPTFFFFFPCDQIAAWLWLGKIILTRHASQCFGENTHTQIDLLMSDSRCEIKKKANLWGFFFFLIGNTLKKLSYVFVLFRLIMTSALCHHNRC